VDKLFPPRIGPRRVVARRRGTAPTRDDDEVEDDEVVVVVVIAAVVVDRIAIVAIVGRSSRSIVGTATLRWKLKNN